MSRISRFLVPNPLWVASTYGQGYALAWYETNTRRTAAEASVATVEAIAYVEQSYTRFRYWGRVAATIELGVLDPSDTAVYRLDARPADGVSLADMTDELRVSLTPGRLAATLNDVGNHFNVGGRLQRTSLPSDDPRRPDMPTGGELVVVGRPPLPQEAHAARAVYLVTAWHDNATSDGRRLTKHGFYDDVTAPRDIDIELCRFDWTSQTREATLNMVSKLKRTRWLKGSVPRGLEFDATFHQYVLTDMHRTRQSKDTPPTFVDPLTDVSDDDDRKA